MPECKYGPKCYRKNPQHIAECHTDRKEEETKKGKEPEARKRKKAAPRQTPSNTKDLEKAPERPDSKGTQSVKEVAEGAGPREKQSKFDRQPLHPTPTEVADFLQHARVVKPEEPLGAFASLKGLRLVGPFEELCGLLSRLSDDQIRLHWRHENDLPEMQTIAVYSGGRFVLWRDEPSSSACLLVHVAGSGRDSFPALSVIGDHPAYMLLHLRADPSLLPAGMDMDGLAAHAKRVLSARRKISLGSPLHGSSGPRIAVPVQNDVGYRPIPESPAKLKKLLSLIACTDDEDLREAKMDAVREMFAYIQMANDEMDFGMGLEYGHDVFLANGERLDRAARQLLSTAYSLLGRDEFGEIVRVQFEGNNRRREHFSEL